METYFPFPTGLHSSPTTSISYTKCSQLTSQETAALTYVSGAGEPTAEGNDARETAKTAKSQVRDCGCQLISPQKEKNVTKHQRHKSRFGGGRGQNALPSPVCAGM